MGHPGNGVRIFVWEKQKYGRDILEGRHRRIIRIDIKSLDSVRGQYSSINFTAIDKI